MFEDFLRAVLDKNLILAVELKEEGIGKGKWAWWRLWGVSNEELMEKVYKLDIDGMTVNFPDKLKQLMAGDKYGRIKIL